MNRNQTPFVQRLLVLMTIVTVLVGFLTTVWLVPQVAAWVTFGHSAPLGFWRAQAMFIHLLSTDKAHTNAYPPVIAAAISDHSRLAIVVGLVLACEMSLAVGAVLRLDRTTSRPMADRRWWDPRGIRPRAFARPHTIDELLVTDPDPMRLVVGRYDQALLAVQENLQTLVVAAPRTGKTSGLVIPAILEHAGPVINTTVRTDVRDRTIALRSKLGRVFVWDPFGKKTDGWDLLRGCEDWAHALRCARWLTSAESIGDGGNTEYFKLEAEQLLAPLLHAAALWPMQPFKTMRDVYKWVQIRAEDEPMEILHMAKAEDAIRRFQSVYAYNDRQRDGIIGAAAAVLHAYGQPAVERTLTATNMLTPEKLFAPGQTNTLYIVADREHQKMLAPLVVTLISTLLHHVAAQENDGRPLQPPCLCALDETANIAPLEDLPEILATSLPSIRFVTVWHSVAQIQRHYQDHGAGELLALSQAKIFLGSITDRATVDEVTRLLANRSQDRLSTDERASQSLQRTSDRKGLLIHTHKPPVVFRQRRYYLDTDLRRLATGMPLEKRLNPLAFLLPALMILAFTAIALLVGPRMALLSTLAMVAVFLAPLRQSLDRAASAVATVAVAVVGLGAGSPPLATATPTATPPAVIHTQPANERAVVAPAALTASRPASNVSALSVVMTARRTRHRIPGRSSTQAPRP